MIPKLREAVLIPQRKTQELAAEQIGVSTQTLFRGRKDYGGLRMDMDQEKRTKDPKKENARLKRLLAVAACW